MKIKFPKIEYNVKIESKPRGFHRPKIKMDLLIDCRDRNIDYNLPLGTIMFVPHEIIDSLLEYKNRHENKIKIDYNIQKIDTEINSEKISYYRIFGFDKSLCYFKPVKENKTLRGDCSDVCYKIYNKESAYNIIDTGCSSYISIAAVPYKTINNDEIIKKYHFYNLHREYQYPFYSIKDKFSTSCGKKVLHIIINGWFNNESYVKLQIRRVCLQWRPVPDYSDILELFTKVPYIILNECKLAMDFSPESEELVYKFKEYNSIKYNQQNEQIGSNKIRIII